MQQRREFTKLLAASFLSQSGSHLMTIALAGFVLASSGSLARSALVFILSYLPSICVGGRAGGRIDRRLSRRLLVRNEFLSIIVSALCGVCVASGAPLVLLYVLISLRSLLLFTARSAGIKWIKLITPAAAQPTRVRYFYLSFFLATAAAGVLAVTTLTRPSVNTVVFINAATYLLSAAVLRSLRELPPYAEADAHGASPGTLASLREILGCPELARHFVNVCMAQCVFQGAYSVLVSYLPVVRFRLGVSGVGVFQLAASFGIIAGFVALWLRPDAFGGEGRARRPAAMLCVGAAGLLACASAPALGASLFSFFLFNAAFECVWLHNASEFIRLCPQGKTARYQFVLTASASCSMATFILSYAASIELFGLRAGAAAVMAVGLLVWWLVSRRGTWRKRAGAGVEDCMDDVVIFLEPKGAQMEIVREAKRRGFGTVVFASDPNVLKSLSHPYASALDCIDAVYPVENWSRTEEVMSLADGLVREGKAVRGVYSGLDTCAVPCATLRKRFGLPTPEPETIELILDKHRLRTRLLELGLSRLRTFHGSGVDGWDEWRVGRPAYFKPVHGASSMYVERCESLSDLRRARRKWREDASPLPKYVANYLNSKREYHLEEAFDGELMSVEAVWFRGRFHYVGLTSRILYSKNPTIEMGSCFPYPHPLADKIVEHVRRAHAALGFTDGPAHTEVIVSPQGEVEIIDLNPRFVGVDVLQSINFAYGIRFQSALCDWALGVEPTIRPKGNEFSCLQYILPPRQLIFESLDFPEAPEVKFHTTLARPGAVVYDLARQVDYMGCYLTVQPSYAGALERSRELRDGILINRSLRATY